MKANDAMFIELLQRGDSTFMIPPYQRDYKWTEDNVINLLESLEFYKDLDIQSKPSNYYLGNIILKEKNSGEFIVVDGQQRLTTISLIARCFYHLASQIEDKVIGETKNELSLLKTQLKNILYVKDGNDNIQKFKISFSQKNTQLSESIKTTNNIDQIIKNPTNIYQKNLKLIHDWFSEKLKQYGTPEKKFNYILNWYNQAFNKIAVARIELDAKDEECVVFETINTSAKPLEEHELVKNWIYMKSQNNPNEDERQDNAEFFTEKLEVEFTNNGLVDESKLKTFLGLFAEYKEGKPFQTSETKKQFYNSIYDWYKKNYKNCFSTADRIEIERYLEFYKAIFHIDGIQENLFKFHYMTTYNTFYKMNQENFDFESKQFIDKKFYNATLLNLNKYYFVKLFASIPFKGAVTESSRIYEQLKNKNEMNFNSKYGYDDWELWVKTFENFENAKFLLKSVDPTSKILLFKNGKLELFRLLFWAIEKNKDNTFDSWELFNDTNKVSTEHIFPQKWEGTNWPKKLPSDYPIPNFLHYSGNVILLEPRKNSKGSNDELEEKIDIYKNSRFSTTREVVKFLENGWNLEVNEEIHRYFLENILNVLDIKLK